MTSVISAEEKVNWAKEMMKELERLLKQGDKFNAIQAKVKLEKIKTLSEEEFVESAIASYDRVHE